MVRLPRVDCPVCRRNVAARQDGTPRDHDATPGSDPRGPVCPGAYRRRPVREPYPMDLAQMRRIDHGAITLRELLVKGTRQQHGIGPNTPLTPAMRRDIQTALRATARIFEADKRNRRAHRW